MSDFKAKMHQDPPLDLTGLLLRQGRGGKRGGYERGGKRREGKKEGGEERGEKGTDEKGGERRPFGNVAEEAFCLKSARE